MRREFFLISALVLAGVFGAAQVWPMAYYSLIFFGPIFLVGLFDVLQTRQTIRRNFPVLGHFRYMLEAIRPEIQQYFIETNEDGMPFSREARSIVYQRSKKTLDTVPFGTQVDVYEEGYEWINHSLAAKEPPKEDPRVMIGEGHCSQPYSASILNISAMSYGALSSNAILALNRGAKKRNFYHNTGEGAISPFHLEHGGDLVWQIGTGYFGCRTDSGGFSAEKFKEKAALPSVKMIELKLSQGAKPGHGGILPASKVTPAISEIRGVPMGVDVVSPPVHREFSDPIGMLEFITKLRELSGGKPVGMKMCLGKRREFFAICKAMVQTGLHPDYIAIDGSESGTGAAPLEFSNSIGSPLSDALIFIHNALTGCGLRKKIKIIASGKIITGFHMASKIALGADLLGSGRGMMFALGCIQALRCNNNMCPTGVATQDPALVKGLVVEDKFQRVANYHQLTVHGFKEVLAAAGLSEVSQLEPWHIQRRVHGGRVQHYGQLYDFLSDGELLEGEIPAAYARAWENADANSF